MQIVLLINGVTKHREDCEFVFANALREQHLLKNFIERIKLLYLPQLNKADFWEIYIIHKSKINQK